MATIDYSFYFIVMERYCYCPAVSQIWAFARRFPDRGIVLDEYSTPIVGMMFPGLLSFENIWTMLVFPTPESPTIITTSVILYS